MLEDKPTGSKRWRGWRSGLTSWSALAVKKWSWVGHDLKNGVHDGLCQPGIDFKASVHCRTRSDDPISCHEKPLKGTDRFLAYPFILLVPPLDFPIATDRIVWLSPKVDRAFKERCTADRLRYGHFDGLRNGHLNFVLQASDTISSSCRVGGNYTSTAGKNPRGHDGWERSEIS